MKNLVLTGMMGAGKTTCGKLLAQALNRTFVDMDEEIIRRDGRKIEEIFHADGEAFFRNMETAVARDLAARENLVIATGGGVILRTENMDALGGSGVVIFLNRSAEAIFDAGGLGARPLAQDGKAAFLTTFAKRKERYFSTADVIFTPADTPEKTVSLLLAQLKEREDANEIFSD